MPMQGYGGCGSFAPNTRSLSRGTQGAAVFLLLEIQYSTNDGEKYVKLGEEEIFVVSDDSL